MLLHQSAVQMQWEEFSLCHVLKCVYNLHCRHTSLKILPESSWLCTTMRIAALTKRQCLLHVSAM